MILGSVHGPGAGARAGGRQRYTAIPGETVSDTLAAVLKEEPDWERVPVHLRKLLRNCLQKDPKRRLRDSGDVWGLLDEAPQAISLRHSRLPLRFYVSPSEKARFAWTNHFPAVSPE